MKTAWIITNRELKSIFYNSWVAMIILLVFYLISGFFFEVYIEATSKANLAGYFQNMLIVLMFAIPLLTARAFTEERKQNTLELLFTSPITDAEIYFGKFLAYFIFFLVMIAPVVIYSAFIFIWGKPALGVLFSSFLGYLLLGAVFVCIGLLFSAVSRNQVVAGLVSIIVILFLYIIDWVKTYIYKPFWKDVITNISFSQHLQNTFQGMLDWNDMLYFVLLLGFLMYTSISLLEYKKQ